MPKPNELTQMQFLNLFTYEALEGKRYFNGASEVMRASGSAELDPVHFVRYALTDVFAPFAVQRFIERFEITVEEVESAMRQLQHEGFSAETARNGDTVEGATRAMKKMYESLRTRYMVRDESAEWNWYHQAFLVAIESVESLAVNHLLARREVRV